jgi:signal transduction histidine kinase
MAETGRQILIVDGDWEFSQSLAERLEKREFLVCIAAPEQILKSLGDLNADIVLCDIEGNGEPRSNLLAEILKARPDVDCVAMARRPDLRLAVNPAASAGVAFINKCQSIDAAVEVVQTCFKKREARLMGPSHPELLERTQAAIEDANRARLEFLAKVSHELRTPLNAIIGFSELIIRDVFGPLGNDQYKAYVEDIHASGRHLLDIINDILDFAKAEAGKLVLEESFVDIHEVVNTIMRILAPRIRDAGIEFDDRLSEKLPQLWCDERKLKQMLLNLLTNSVKFTPSGGQIVIDAEVRPDGYAIRVRDTGVGIAKADLARVLQPFMQADNTFSRQKEGTGLGLPLTKAMVEIHGGNLDLRSEAGKGTAVTLIFPLERVGACHEEANYSMPAAEPQKRSGAM